MPARRLPASNPLLFPPLPLMQPWRAQPGKAGVRGQELPPARGSGAGGCRGGGLTPHKALQSLRFPEGEGALPPFNAAV